MTAERQVIAQASSKLVRCCDDQARKFKALTTYQATDILRKNQAGVAQW